MGNCIGTEFELSHNHKKVSPHNNEADAKASAELCEASFSLAAILKSSDVYRLMPQMIQQSSLKPTPENCNGQRIKIVARKPLNHCRGELNLSPASGDNYHSLMNGMVEYQDIGGGQRRLCYRSYVVVDLKSGIPAIPECFLSIARSFARSKMRSLARFQLMTGYYRISEKRKSLSFIGGYTFTCH
ncbi:hypothetical protein BUALT_Bualt03G0090700 [Buddleja alternifolia]|uniref:Uncharacterized protein n=1 Tax=Buddleja alternifolia TaxID=168488 RepID=A0AAV6XZ14_9LAMI|nr:hypothetical protein BUALT_Bualt03G0090700 [Buddleja alternifolia]